jgi:hypothetical protein
MSREESASKIGQLLAFTWVALVACPPIYALSRLLLSAADALLPPILYCIVIAVYTILDAPSQDELIRVEGTRFHAWRERQVSEAIVLALAHVHVACALSLVYTVISADDGDCSYADNQ